MPAVDIPHEHPAPTSRRPPSFGYDGATTATLPIGIRAGRGAAVRDGAHRTGGSPTGVAYGHDTVSPGSSSEGFDTLSSSQYRRYLDTIEAKPTLAVLKSIRRSQHPARQGVSFAELCELFPKLDAKARTALRRYALEPASVARLRPDLMRPILASEKEPWMSGGVLTPVRDEGAAQREIRQAAVLGEFISELRTDEDVLQFTRLVAPEFTRHPAIAKESLLRRIGIIEDPEIRETAEKTLRV